MEENIVSVNFFLSNNFQVTKKLYDRFVAVVVVVPMFVVQYLIYSG